MATSQQKGQLKVMFDTNTLHNQSASDLLRREIVMLIEEVSKHSDLEITWQLPEMVVDERIHQMTGVGVALLGCVRKLGKLLDPSLNVTPEVIETRVKGAVEQSMQEYGIERVKLKTAEVDWERIIDLAVRRKPPFSEGEKEKGFRDAIVAETFMQMMNDSPRTPGVCLLAMVTGDRLLRGYIDEQCSGKENVKIFESLEEVHSWINTIDSEVEEEYVAALTPVAEKYFYVDGDMDTLFYKLQVREKIDAEYPDALKELPEGATRRIDEGWHIGSAVFERKDGDTTFWRTKVTSLSHAYKDHRSMFGSDLSWLPVTVVAGEQSSMAPYVQGRPSVFGRPIVHGLVIGGPERPIYDGESIFEVLWRVSVDDQNRLGNPEIEEIQYVETTWSPIDNA